MCRHVIVLCPERKDKAMRIAQRGAYCIRLSVGVVVRMMCGTTEIFDADKLFVVATRNLNRKNDIRRNMALFKNEDQVKVNIEILKRSCTLIH